jgi:hypothetical protein
MHQFSALILGLLIFALGSSFCPKALAQSEESSNSMKIPASGSGSSNYVPGSEEIDNVLTNKNLRALSGSVSRWSFASQFNYNGGSAQNPMSQDRPNIADASATTIKSDLDGSLWLKYNLNPKDSLMAGFGIRWIAPLEKNGPSNYDGTTFDAINPEVQYQRIYKLSDIQAVLQVSFLQWTQADQTAYGYAQQLCVDQENMYEIEGSGFSLGASIWGLYQTFNKSGSYGSSPDSNNYVSDLAAVQSDYGLSFTPILEYEITEKLNFRGTVGLAEYEHYRSQTSWSFKHDKVVDSLGVGIAFTRDIVVTPSIQFLNDDIRADQTNLSVNSTINLF